MEKNQRRSSITQQTQILTFLISLGLVGCFGKKEHEMGVDISKETVSFVFSHNLNGETHPCGCRHFPLGGLPQVAGKIHEIKQKSSVILIDTGDTFFPSTKVPSSMQQSQSFGAQNLARGLSQLGLNLYLPGDQDLAQGFDFLKKIIEENSFTMLVANLSQPLKKNFKRWISFKAKGHIFFLTGHLDRQLIPGKYHEHFTPSGEALQKVFTEMQKAGYSKTNKKHHLIVLSHAGLTYDEALAKKFPHIDWIIGAHSQSFTPNPVQEGKTKIVQVLSRNHHLGEIKFNLSKMSEEFHLYEVRDELAQKLKPNPFVEFIAQHKKKMGELQEKEQSTMNVGTSDTPWPAPKTCLDCHDSQYKFWGKTSHALAYATLINASEEHNLTCVKCHSHGLNQPHGFKRVQDIVSFSKDHVVQGELALKRYLDDLRGHFKDVSSIRELSSEKRMKHFNQWESFNNKHNIENNFANVQCLNCHDKHLEHPFAMDEKKWETPEAKSERRSIITQKCLACHDPDQSPEWYDKNEKGLATVLNQKKFDQHYKKISCPAKE